MTVKWFEFPVKLWTCLKKIDGECRWNSYGARRDVSANDPSVSFPSFKGSGFNLQTAVLDGGVKNCSMLFLLERI